MRAKEKKPLGKEVLYCVIFVETTYISEKHFFNRLKKLYNFYIKNSEVLQQPISDTFQSTRVERCEETSDRETDHCDRCSADRPLIAAFLMSQQSIVVTIATTIGSICRLQASDPY